MDKNRLIISLLPVIVALSIVAGLFIGRQAGGGHPAAFTGGGDKLSYTMSLIDNMYVDHVDTDSIVEALMPDMMATLDPHSVYIPARDMERVSEELDGEFDGIGVVFNMSTDTIVVLNVIPRGPSYHAGVQNGDRIIYIGDSLVAGRKIPQDSVVRMLRGPSGTQVKLSVSRQNIDDLVAVSITRGKIPLRSLDAAFMIRPGVGFVRITSFTQHTYQEMMTALAALHAQGMTSLVVDLRGNAGGYLDQPILMANEFLDGNKLIVYTEGRARGKIKEFSRGDGTYRDVALAVLIDEGSASSSEILTGALQDNDRATVVGRRSFGKGLVQQQIPLPDGSAIRLTTERYFTPTGRSIQKPYTAGDDSYSEDIYNRFLHNEMFSADSIHLPDSLKFTTPGGRTVYGGGGIMPDIFVPLDTVDVTDYYAEVAGRNIIYRYTMEWSDRHRAGVNAVGSVADLDALLPSDAELLEDFVAYAARNGMPARRAEIRKSEKLLVAVLRALIGRNTPLEEAGYYANIYVVDSTMLRALESLEE